jgi:predicted dithiol-disulfide oxidoreductase (DUF899 family)
MSANRRARGGEGDPTMTRPASEIDNEIEALETQIGAMREKIAALRRDRAPEPVRDYDVTTSSGARVRLSALFGDRKDLLLVHNMGSKCPMCSTWADGFNGLLAHYENRAAFVVSSPDAPDVQRRFAESRGWRFRMASVGDSTLAADLGFRTAKGDWWPGISILRRTDDGSIVRVGKSSFGPGDDFCPLFHVLALFPEGQNDWWPKLTYAR